MKRMLTAAVFLAAAMGMGAASAATVVYSPGGVGAPAPANKITTEDVDIGDFVSTTEILSPGDTAEFQYTALSDLRVNGFSLSGTDNASGTDLANVKFGFTSPATNSFTSIFAGPGGTGSATGSLPFLVASAGDTFTIFWEDGVTAPVAVTASFNVSQIPLPAGLPLLVGALAVLGVARRRAA